MTPRAARAVAALTVCAALVAGCTRVVETGPPGVLSPERTTATWQTLPPDTPSPSGNLDAGRSEPVEDPVYPEFGTADLDVLHYQLDLTWSPTSKQLTGTATLTIRVVRPVAELVLDFASGYDISSVKLDGAAATPQRRGDDLVVTAPGPLAANRRVTLVVAYAGRPRPVPMPSSRTDFPEGLGLRPTPDGSAWTMQEPYGAFTWYPVNDHPSDEALYDILVTVPAGWSAVASGRLRGSGPVSGGVRFHWHSADPVASYLTTLAIGRYRMVTDTGPRGIPITYWLRPGDDRLEPALRTTVPTLRWLEERFGPYPFDSAGVVLVASESAMETQQMVTMGADIGPPEYVEVIVVHELAHQWFGDSITPRDWRGVWLNEGFAMYAQGLWEIEQGRTTLSRWLAQARSVDARSRATAGPPGNWDADHFGESNIYFGPALMLHEIREEIGDNRFFALARDWVQTQRNRPVDRATFTAFVNRHTGRDFTPVINKWLDSPRTPD